jgi:hypothetical protein
LVFKYGLQLILLLTITVSYSQISPGELSEAHKSLEGMSNCTQCHELGEKVYDRKCLECHKEIQTLINQKRGLHAKPSVIKQDCFECHSEHHGRKFDMVRFDEDNFNHNDTGYKLEGKHDIIDCRACHKPDYIQDNEIRKRKNTFLGLNKECLSCHEDFHQKTLSKDCMQCHDTQAFRPASKFNHDKADFKLEGKHVKVNCKECHKTIVKNGKEFQEFANIDSKDCISCHQDPHENKLPGQCAACHTEDSFSFFKGQGNFDHKKTNFDLKGKHNTVDCFQCHKETDRPLMVFQDNLRINENDCVQCHEDVHEAKFGLDCARCHSEQSFHALKNMKSFDHAVTDYPLEGKHIDVDCKQCHKGSYTKAIDFSACNKCHDDYHKGEFKENGISADCAECHSLQEGFEYSLYTLEQHQKNSFPLEGAHVATPCYACHVSETDDRWKFNELGSKCIDCHKDFHKNYINEKFYPNQDCNACHTNESWEEVAFDHEKTNWPLEGKHLQVNCRQCHFVENPENKQVADQKFTNLDTDCVSCHDNVHGDTFSVDGVTDCVECHVTSSWIPENFNHNTTRFRLEGKHRLIDCRACHISEIVNGETNIIYKLNKLKCIDCHL